MTRPAVFKSVARLVLVGLVCGALGGGRLLPASAVSVTFIYGLDGVTQGASPNSAPIIDTSGNLYGVTFAGGAGNSGTVFRLKPPSAKHAPWVETNLWSFTGGQDGASPVGSLIQDRSGALYGTASGGGAHGGGTVFLLTPPAAGQTAWTQSTLWAFKPGRDGGNPSAGLIAAADGTLYGTTASYGGDGYGTVFHLVPPATGQTGWTLQTLWTFTDGADGANPLGSLLIDMAGNLYGTASRGGTNPIGGVVFELSPSAGDGAPWTQTTLWSFTGPDGLHPAAALVADTAGRLYGTTAFGGAQGRGTVFQLSPPSSGAGWTLATLCHLSPTAGGIHPFSPLLFDAAGVLYGTTYGYAPLSYYAYISTLFSLTPPPAAGDGWTVTILATLSPKTNGADIIGGLTADANGHLFGTLVQGPRSTPVPGAGGVFEAVSTGFKPFR